MNTPIFITGIGTGIGKTVVSSILVEAMECDYWKPIQAGNEFPTDSQTVQQNLTNVNSVIYPEFLSLKLPVSPHFAASEEGIGFTVHQVCEQIPKYNCNLVIEGAGGLFVPLNDKEFIIDLIKELNARVVLVSAGYLGSINHSMLTAKVCRMHGLNVAGWVFNDSFKLYEEQISAWSGYPLIFSLPKTALVNKRFVNEMAEAHRESIKTKLC